jgi:SAM-dependent methyltransferase
MQLIWRDVAIGNGPAINTSLTLDETAKLQELAKDADVLEIGSAYGYSTVALALVAKSVTAIDPHITHNSFGTLHANLGIYGVAGKVTVVRGFSQDLLPKMVAVGDKVKKPKRFDLVWIDGDHTASTVEHDVTWALKLLKPGGVLACHDYDEVTCPGVRQALDKLFGGPGELTDTLAVYRTVSGPDESGIYSITLRAPDDPGVYAVDMAKSVPTVERIQ